MHRQIVRSALATLALGASTLSLQAHAAESLCTPSLKLDREKLATYLLDKHPVSTAYLTKGSQHAPLDSNLALVQWLLKKRAAAPAQTGPDAASVDLILRDVLTLLDGKNAQLKPTGKTTPLAYFSRTDRGSELACTVASATPEVTPAAPLQAAGTTAAGAAAGGVATATAAATGQSTAAAVPAAGAPAPAPAPAPAAPPGPEVTQSVFGKLRLRGNPDQLAIDRSNAGAYASADKATLALANDTVAGSRTNDIRAYLGYSLIKSEPNAKGTTFEVVPYVGLKQNRVIVFSNGADDISTTRTTNIGTLVNYHFVHLDSDDTDDLSLRPDFLMDSSTGTRLLSANFTYTPVRKRLLNDPIPTNYGVSVKPILVGESRNGAYIDRGDETVFDSHRNFVRLGARAGFGLVSNNPAIPLDFVLTYTGLQALVGNLNIHYLRSALTYNFNQTMGLSLNYSTGLLPDSGDREKKWNLGITSKF
ncbi:MAG: hypothetical protein ACRYGK_14100 [Janthinobacterium lividum]